MNSLTFSDIAILKLHCKKTQAGFYNYDDNGKAQESAEVIVLLTKTAKELGFKAKNFTDEEIVQRALFALISEGLALQKEGIVQRLSDIDVIWLHGYGFPRYKGGPMFQAQLLGAKKVAEQLAEYRALFGEEIWPDVDVRLLS